MWQNMYKNYPAFHMVLKHRHPTDAIIYTWRASIWKAVFTSGKFQVPPFAKGKPSLRTWKHIQSPITAWHMINVYCTLKVKFHIAKCKQTALWQADTHMHLHIQTETRQATTRTRMQTQTHTEIQLWVYLNFLNFKVFSVCQTRISIRFWCCTWTC